MKLTTYLFISSLLICAACSNDELINEDSQNQEKSIITAFGSLPQSITTRMACQEQSTASGTELAILWGSDTGAPENIGVTDGSNIYEFCSTGLSGTSSTAKFEYYGTFSAVAGTPFYAVYPANCLSYSNPSQADLDITYRNPKAGNFNTILWSSANLKADNTLDFQFKYLNSVLKINIKPFEDSESIAPYCTSTTSYSLMQTTINVLAEEGLYKSAKLNMETGEVTNTVQATELPLFSVDFTFDGSKTSLSDCYQSIFPGPFKKLKIAFNLIDGIYTADIVDDYTFEKGKFYYTKDLVPKKVGFIIAKTDLKEAGIKETISLETILDRITTRDNECGNEERKTLIVDALGGSCPFQIGFQRPVIDTEFETKEGDNPIVSEFEQSNKYNIEAYTTQASILGNWLRTKATSVQLVDMSPSLLTKIPDYMFYGCSKKNTTSIGNSALTQLILPDGITTIGEKAFADSGITQLKLMHYNTTTLTSVKNSAFDDVSAIKLYLPRISNATDAQEIQDKFKVNEKVPTVYYNYNNTGSATEDFTDSNYTLL